MGPPVALRCKALRGRFQSRRIELGPWAKSDLASLAAAYGFGIARNHPFVDGNKRTSLMAIYVFLGLNDIELDVAEEEFAAVILGLAAGEIDEDGLTRWIGDNWPT